ncbi:MAG: hypothetical protein HKM93_01240 [Desulfobacteraceae bacterium]|nr:hypothetical protein [Desulfobacteraceae bacterium]
MMLFILTALTSVPFTLSAANAEGGAPQNVVLLYFNGDNNLNGEVLHALDMIETVGSSENLHIFVLYDGHKDYVGDYGPEWAGTRLIYVTRDDEMGVIRSRVIEDYGERNLGVAETLEAFIRKGLEIEADRYMFGIFSHGRGIIDTDRLAPSGPHKTLAISVDDTDAGLLTLGQFREAIQRPLAGRKFELMIFFTCLTNMVEIGYELKEVTRYIIGSEDEIRIVNSPPGRFQIRGIRFERFLKTIFDDPGISARDIGVHIVDDYIGQYAVGHQLPDVGGVPQSYRYAGSLSITDCGALDPLASELDVLAGYLMEKLESGPEKLRYLEVIRRAQSASQRYPSFLNLEYYDLPDYLHQLGQETTDTGLKILCSRITQMLRDKVLVYEKHTDDTESNGLSIYLSHTGIPENIFSAHQQMYRQSRFSIDTQWDELIDRIRSTDVNQRSVGAGDRFEPATH